MKSVSSPSGSGFGLTESFLKPQQFGKRILDRIKSIGLDDAEATWAVSLFRAMPIKSAFELDHGGQLDHG